ncbi:MAG TPA: DUF6457 domain-containing protein [Candidatus Limnocylindria bacterium]
MTGPDASAAVPLDAWLERVRAELGVESPRLTEPEREALLDLTRLAAHTSERVAGPLTVYALGMAAAGLPDEDRLERIRNLLARLASGS